MTENTCRITNIVVSINRIEISYDIVGDWRQYLNLAEPFFVEYEYDISSVPKGIAVIPFICNILPIAWLCDAEIIVPEIDDDFFISIPEFKAGYEKMYPMLSFKGKVSPQSIIHSDVPGKKSAAFFSGGVDAFSTLITHKDEHPVLITLWGSDVPLDDKKGWNVILSHTKKSASLFNTEHLVIRTNFRKFINTGLLGGLVTASRDGWWHGFQHGIGIISHAAPIAYILGLKKIYIASSWVAEMIGHYTCASDPTIDNFVHFCGCTVIHDGYEFSRQNKVRRICEYVKTGNPTIPLHVCWATTTGKNCCVCEKCLRTIIEIVSEGGDPNDYGFFWTSRSIKIMKHLLKTSLEIPPRQILGFWKISQKRIIENAENIKNYDEYRWFINMDLDTLNSYPLKKLKRLRIVKCAIALKRKFLK